MTKDEFLSNCTAGTDLTEDERYTLWIEERKLKRQPVKTVFVVVDNTKPEGYKDPEFDTIEGAFAFELEDGRTVGDIIESWSDVPTEYFDGEQVFHYKDDK